MPMRNLCGLWDRESKAGNNFSTSAKTTARKFFEAFKEAREALGVGPDDEIQIGMFPNQKKTNEKAPNKNIVIIVSAKKEEKREDAPF